MIQIRPSQKRGRGKLDWLNSFYTFSFSDYTDPNWNSRGYLRVINEDFIQPGRGFDLHPHRDMEIITYVLSGALKHSDSMGNGTIIRPGEIQRMSAGTGVHHSEFNASDKETLHLLQIWIFPEQKGIQPGYEQKRIPALRNELILIGASDPTEHAIKIHQQVELYVGYFDPDVACSFVLNDHDAWLQVIHGELQVNDDVLNTGDGAWIQQEQIFNFKCIKKAEFLIFKML